MSKKNAAVSLCFIFLLFLAFFAGFFVGHSPKAAMVSRADYEATGVPVVSEGNVDKEIKIVKINSATMDELISVPGIGEKTAATIIAAREQYGPFSSLWELDAIEGIGEKKLAQIAPYLSFE